MRLLHVFQSFEVGGIQARFARIANHHGGRFQHLVLALNGDLTCRAQLVPRLDVAFYPAPKRRGSMAGNVLSYRAMLRDLRPDRLVTYGWGAMEWAVANTIFPGLGAPLVPHLHVESAFGPGKSERRLARRSWLRRLYLRRSVVAVPSRTLMDVARSEWRIRPAHLRYVPNGVDFHRFRPHPLRTGGALPATLPVIGTVAALRPVKNLARLLRAFALALQQQPARLMIVGDGVERRSLQQLAVELGIARAVTFAGPTAVPEQAYAALDIFALSSDSEQMPNSLLEAMASGLPVAATDVGDVRAMLPDAARCFVVRRDDAALAGALAALLRNAGLRHDVGMANRAHSEAYYGEDRMLRAWAGLFEEKRRGADELR